jgi:hypothetical protein
MESSTPSPRPWLRRCAPQQREIPPRLKNGNQRNSNQRHFPHFFPSNSVGQVSPYERDTTNQDPAREDDLRERHGTCVVSTHPAADAFPLPSTTISIKKNKTSPFLFNNSTHTQQLVDDLVNATNSYRSLKIRVTKQGQEIEAWQTKVRVRQRARAIVSASGAWYRRRPLLCPTLMGHPRTLFFDV